jgi:hypothetical protein
MNLESQVCSLEIAKRLKELGCEQKSLFFWSSFNNKWYLQDSSNGSPMQEFIENNRVIVAYTVAEIEKLLPSILKYGNCTAYLEYHHKNRELGYWLDGENEYGKYHNLIVINQEYCHYQATTMADAYGKMLIYLLENKLI